MFSHNNSKLKPILIALTALFVVLLIAAVIVLSVLLASKPSKNVCETKSCIKSGKILINRFNFS